jgi:hypothetical protein
MVGGLSAEHFAHRVSMDDDFPSIVAILRHIGNAETYWFHKSGHGIGPPLKGDDPESTLDRLEENTHRITETVSTCEPEQLRIVGGVPGPQERGPSVAWAVLRTYQHGLYHAAQVAKIRRIIGAPPLPDEEVDSWAMGVDSVIGIVDRLLDPASLGLDG